MKKSNLLDIKINLSIITLKSGRNTNINLSVLFYNNIIPTIYLQLHKNIRSPR